MARITNDIIYDNYDRFTGESFNATITTTWYDGSPMDDSKVDNCIYFKNQPLLGGGYSKRNFESAVNVKWFGVKGIEGAVFLDEYNAIKKAWDFCRMAAIDLYFPSGIYDVGARNFPFRVAESDPIGDVLDCKNITIYGDGDTSILRTTSANGADVLQLNKLKNINIRDFSITATVSTTNGAGTNGISITNGFDNINISNILVFKLRAVDKVGTGLDGGKALTVQTGVSTPYYCGSIRAKKIRSIDCAYGFTFDGNLSNILSKNTSIEVDIIVENSFSAINSTFSAATAAIDVTKTCAVKLNCISINSQKDVVLSRAIGVDLNLVVQTTKSKADLRLAFDGTPWTALTNTVTCIQANYIKNSKIDVIGNKNECDTKFAIGAVGAVVEPFAINRTENSVFNFNLNGTASTSDFVLIEDSGNSIYQSILNITSNTLTTLPSNIYLAVNKNLINIGNDTRSNTASYTGVVATNSNFHVDAPVSLRGFKIFTSASLRFFAYLDNTAESGSGAGSNFTMTFYNDIGAFLRNQLIAIRSTGAGIWAGSWSAISMLISTLPTLSSFGTPSTHDVLTRNISTGAVERILGTVAFVTSSNVTLSNPGYISYNGTGGTFTLPSAASSINRPWTVIHRGTSGNLVINANASANEIYSAGTLVNTITLTTGQSVKMVSDGTYIIVYKYV